MKNAFKLFGRVGLLAVTLLIFWWVLNHSFSKIINLSLIAGSALLVYPAVWLGRVLLDKNPTVDHTIRITTFVHYTVMILLGTSIIRAVSTYKEWPFGVLPVPAAVGLVLVIITGAAALFSVVNLALKGLGAPFAIALSRKLTADWMYAWTRNPMVLSTLAFLLSLGIWFQSLIFLLWVLILFTPALLFFVKVYEERELEIRFGTSYLEYKSRTPMLFPRKPKA